jgi:two-component system, OmpR family, response regulator
VKVLIIDDEPDVRSVARLSLGRVGGMEVVELPGGREAVAVAKSEAPDVILLDLMMPEMDGVATFEALRAEPRTAGIPIVFVTAKAMPDEIHRLKSLGALEVIVKPFDPMTLAADLREILAR